MIDVTIKSDDVDNLVRAIRKNADAKALRKELYSGLNRASKGVRGEMKEVVPAALPTRGGLAQSVQGALRSRTSAKSGKYAGVSIWFTAKGHDVRLLTGKRLRHPVFGNRNSWVTQTAGVQPSVFIGKFEDQKPEVQQAILAAMDDVARKIVSGI